MVSGIMGELRQLQAMTEQQSHVLGKQNRMLQDVYVVCTLAAETMQRQEAEPNAIQRLEYCGFKASQAYSGTSLAHLLDSSSSMLSLRIGDLQEDSISAVWSPDPVSRAPVRRVRSKISLSEPTLKDFHNPLHSFAFHDKERKRDSSVAFKYMDNMSKVSRHLSEIALSHPNTPSKLSTSLSKMVSILETTVSTHPTQCSQYPILNQTGPLGWVELIKYGLGMGWGI